MEKEMVQKFDLEAAFKALDEIDTPKAEKGIRANRVDLKERFAAKTYGDALVEDYYNVNDKEALEEAKEDREEEVAKAKLARIEKIVDLDAESPEDLLPSYVGKVIIQCPQCMTLFYKNPEDIEKSEENPDVVNINEICQHCGNASGYTLIGKVGEVSEDEAANYEAAEEGTEEDELNLDFGEPTEEVSPEGTGGGFEDEEIALEEGSEDSSDDELDLDLAEVDLEPTEESLKREQLNEGKLKNYRDNKDFEETDRYVIYCCDDKADIIKTVKVHGTSGEVKKLMNDLLDEHKDAADIFANKIFKNLKTGEEEEVELDSYTVSRDIDESVNKSELLKDAEKHSELATENHSEHLSLNEETLAQDDETKEDTPIETTVEEVKEIATEVAEKVTTPVANEEEAETQQEEIKEVVDEVVAKELELPVVEEGSDDSSDDELTEELTPEQVEQKLTAYAASLGVEEGYTGNPAERTTHLEYTDDDPTDGKAVLPDNIEKQLTEDEKKDCDCKDGICECGDKKLAEGTYDVSDADFRAMLKDKTFQEFGECLKEEKVEESKVSAAAVEKAVGEISTIGVDELADVEESCEHCEGEECEHCAEKKEECKLGDKCEELHEESLNKHISAYLTEVYANVKDFTATNCSLNDNKLVVEGTINFNSGKSRTTKFEFTEAKNDEAGKIILEGYNKDLAEDAHFTLNCLLEDGGTCLLTEGFGYKYTINNTLVEGLK